MIGKIVKGTSFGGCVNYVLKEEMRLVEHHRPVAVNVVMVNPSAHIITTARLP